MFNKLIKSNLKILKRAIQTLVVILLASYIGIILALNIPVVQRAVSSFASDELSKVLGADVSIGNINLGFLNRIILEDVRLNDEQGAELLSVARVSAAYALTPLLDGKIDISSAQLFGFNAQLSKETPDAKPNFQFIIDALSSD